MKKLFMSIFLYYCIFLYPVQAIDLEFQITATAENGGTIIPEGVVNVISGRNKSFVIRPQIAYEIAYLIIDGKMFKPLKLYTFSDVKENHTIQAVFKLKKQYTIAAIAGENGYITPSGHVSVYEYEYQTFQMIPDRGYSIQSINLSLMIWISNRKMNLPSGMCRIIM